MLKILWEKYFLPLIQAVKICIVIRLIYSSVHNMSSLANLTLSIIKPHLVKNPCALQNVKDILRNNGFSILESKRITLSAQMAEIFYMEHKDKFFFNRLISFICSGPVEVYILSRENAIKEWRNLMGPTKVYKGIYSDPQSIRALHGLSDTRNATHGSDSEESVCREIKIIFPNFSFEK